LSCNRATTRTAERYSSIRWKRFAPCGAGEEIRFADGTGTKVPVRIYPRTLQPELPIWITSAGSVETFELAGKIGAGMLTHLLGQEFDDLAGKISIYREAFTMSAS
jgi:alkanesulfonate monooxygenase SsuD/methylene tetrahydromethanopterin reductase-like flavin-dependent oxidoreductase (luciferase family)